MGYYMSPKVDVVETDLTTIVPAVSTNISVYTGRFEQGPVNTRQLITDDRTLEETMGKPGSNTFEDWYTCYNFLQYGDILYITRVVNEDGQSTSLNGAHNDTVTTLTVGSTASFPNSGKLKLNSDEIVSYSGKSSTTFENVTRALAGTTAGTYTGGETVLWAPENSSMAIANRDEAFTAGVAATGTITCVAPSVHAHDDNFTLSDGTTSITYALDLNARETRTFTTLTFAADNVLLLSSTITGQATGDPCHVSSSTTLPSGLSASTVYYINVASATQYTLHPTYADAIAGTNEVTITDAGTGTHTLTYGKGLGVTSSSHIPIDISAEVLSVTAAHTSSPVHAMINDLAIVTLVDASAFHPVPFSNTDDHLGIQDAIATANTQFGVGATISSSTAAGIVRYKSGNTVYVQMTTGTTFTAGEAVDDVPTFSSQVTLVSSSSKLLGITATDANPVALTNDTSGDGASDGNVAITESGAFVVAGMTGGTEPVYHRADYILRYNIDLDPESTLTYSDNEILKIYAKNPGTWGQDLSIAVTNPDDFPTAYAIGNSTSGTTFASLFDQIPALSRREIAIAVIKTDNLGNRQVVEKYIGSLDSTQTQYDNTLGSTSLFIEDVVNNASPYIYVDVNPTSSGDTELLTNIDGGAFGAADVTLTVTDTTGFPTKGTLLIEDEYVTYTGTTPTTFTGCSRGQYDSSAAEHAAGTEVEEWNMVSTITNQYLTGGADSINSRDDILDEILLGYDLYTDPEDIDVNLFMDGANCNESTIQQYLVDSVCEVRLDCMCVLNVPWSSVNYPLKSTAITAMVNYRNASGTYSSTGLNRSSSYAALYGNWKRQYDKYNDTYRWLPVTGDVTGIYARTDQTNDPWYAPAGLNRGKIKNVKQFKVNPNQGDRDILYVNQINPVVSFKGDGPVVWGQKTLLTRPSAFDRVNVRRLFLVLEKAIATASRYYLFEFNNRFVRKQIVSMIEPFLRDVQGRQGIYDFYVKCDEQNNTPAVIQRNELHVDIYIKPTYVAEFIRLNFIATSLGTNFQELFKGN